MRIIAIALISGLAGCAADITAPVDAASLQSVSFGDQPRDWQKQVRSSIGKVFVDPYSIRDVSISQPYKRHIKGFGRPDKYGWEVCLRANAKNLMGGYSGRKVYAFYFENGTLTDTYGPMGMYSECHGMKYEPFSI